MTWNSDNLGVEPRPLKDAELLRKIGQVTVQRGSGNVLAFCETVGFTVHAEIGVLIAAPEIVGLETGVETIS